MTERERKKKKKQRQTILEAELMSFLTKSLDAAMKEAIDEVFKSCK